MLRDVFLIKGFVRKVNLTINNVISQSAFTSVVPGPIDPIYDAYTRSDQNGFSNFESVPGLKLKILTRRALFSALPCMAFSRALELEVVGFGSGSLLVEVGEGL